MTALKISPPGNSSITVGGGTATFTGLATVIGESSPVDVSPTATWTLSDTTDFQLTLGDPVTVQTLSTAAPGMTTTLSASYVSATTITASPVTLTKGGRRRSKRNDRLIDVSDSEMRYLRHN